MISYDAVDSISKFVVTLIGGSFALVPVSIGLLSYVIPAWTLMHIAKDRGEPILLAWIPLVNLFLLYKFNYVNSLWFLLILIPGVNVVVPFYLYVLWYKLGKEYKATEALFWIGIFIVPLMLVYQAQLGISAKNSSSKYKALGDGDVFKSI